MSEKVIYLLLFLFYKECNTVLRIDEYADRMTVFYMCIKDECFCAAMKKSADMPTF